MNEEYRYMTEEELEALIAEVEDHGMLAPPVYLKEQIMGEVGKRKNVEPVKKTASGRRAGNMQLIFYSVKIIGAAAAAIFCLTMVPVEMDGRIAELESRKMEEAIEEDIARYREESERIRSGQADDSWGKDGDFLEGLFGNGNIKNVSSIWQGMEGWFGMEERNND